MKALTNERSTECTINGKHKMKQQKKKQRKYLSTSRIRLICKDLDLKRTSSVAGICPEGLMKGISDDCSGNL